MNATGPARHRPRVAVVGSGTEGHPDLARPVGRALASLGAHLITGGGGGVMSEVARAFVEVAADRGLSIGILPADPASDPPRPPAGYPNPWVEVPVVTHLWRRGEEGSHAGSRNHVIVLSADAVVALPGGAGTASEILLCARYGRPIFTVGRGAAEEGDSPPGIRGSDDPWEIEGWLRALLP